MKIEQENSGLLVNEWQLGQQLNTAVQNGSRDKFNLLLSLLSDDARDFAEFSLPTGQSVFDLDTHRDLRRTFSLPEPQPLVAEGMSASQALQLNKNLENDNLDSIRLQLLLSNEPLLSRKEALFINSDVNDNLPPLLQHRLAKSLQENKEEADLSNAPVSEGVDYNLMADYQALDFDNHPIKVTYM